MPSYIERSTIYRLKTAIKNDTECTKTFDGFIRWSELCNVYGFDTHIIDSLREYYGKIFEITVSNDVILIRLKPLAKRLENNGILANHVRNVLPPVLYHGTSDERLNEIQSSGFLYPGIDGFINFSDTIEKAMTHAKKKYPENKVRVMRISPRVLARNGYTFFYYHGLFRGTEKIDVNYIEVV